jgi:hypothetical protein
MDSDRVLTDERHEMDVATSEIRAQIEERVCCRLTGRLRNFQQRTALIDFRAQEKAQAEEPEIDYGAAREAAAVSAWSEGPRYVARGEWQRRKV